MFLNTCWIITQNSLSLSHPWVRYGWTRQLKWCIPTLSGWGQWWRWEATTSITITVTGQRASLKRAQIARLLIQLRTYLLLASFARSVRQVMDRVFSFLLWPKREARGPWKQGRKKRGSITCCTDRANEANKMFIIWLCRLFRFWKGDRELAVRTATYGPGIDQSQHAKSASHIIITSY